MALFLRTIRTALRPMVHVPTMVAPRINIPVTVPSTPFVQQVRGMANKRHKKMIKLAKGYRGRANRCFTVAIQRVTKARQYAYRDRKVRKRENRKLWIQRINAATRMYGVTYNLFMRNLARNEIALNRKILSDLAITEPLSFKSVVEVSKLVSKKL